MNKHTITGYSFLVIYTPVYLAGGDVGQSTDLNTIADRFGQIGRNNACTE